MTWNEYKEELKNANPRTKADIEEMEQLAMIVTAIIDQREALGLTQRDVAKVCHMAQSSVARIESGKSIPNLTTLLNILYNLNLKIVISKQTAS
ncbi:MAG: helix-turn-helix transcriptional regulator [Lachnospiraceae bacterium]|jgi:predicted transcriptional regulator|nr:helix-turn-helix transcriptional regulator [Lachnospiraceae bacterium]